MCRKQILTYIALLIFLANGKNLVNAMTGQGAVSKYEPKFSSSLNQLDAVAKYELRIFQLQ
jgi:hypothetical protein